MKNLKVRTVTFNVADSGPPSDNFAELFGVGNSNHPDVVFIGLQEVKNDEQWTTKLKETMKPHDFVLIKSRNCWGIWIYAFVKRNLLVALTNIESESTASGALGICGNKGGVSIRFELCGVNIIGVCAHFTAHQKNIQERISDYADIIKGQTFKDSDVNKILDHDYIIWMGDLNFRIELKDKDMVEKMIREKRYRELLAYDQLTITKQENLIFENFKEGEINFDPTYKFDPTTDVYDTSEKKRIPSWTDRILYLAHDGFIYNDPTLADSKGHRIAHQHSKKSTRPPPSSSVDKSDASLNKPKITLEKYDSMPQYKHSDHRPVYADLLLNIPERWFSLPIKFFKPNNSSHPSDKDLFFEYTMMTRPALNSQATANHILAPGPSTKENFNVAVADDQLTEKELSNEKDKTKQVIEVTESLVGAKKPTNSSDPLPPPSITTANSDWIGVYPVDFDDLMNGYLAYVYAPSGQIDMSLCTSMNEGKISKMMGNEHVVLDHGISSGKLYKGHIDEKLLDDLVGRTLQLVYFSRSKRCPQGYSKPFTLPSPE